MSAGGIAFTIGRKLGRHPLAGRLFCLTERLLPLKRITRGDDLVAFHHPRPIADPHVLMVPTLPISAITTDRLSDDQKAFLIWKMFELGREVTSSLPANEHWQLVINGGHRQDIGQMHAHLLHAAECESYGRALADPVHEPGDWPRIFAELRAADEIPGNGYSLTIQWTGAQEPLGEVTQSLRT